MKKKQILKLIDECPYWGEDIESEVMIKDLKKWFEFKLEEDDELMTKKEFKFEIDKLLNEVKKIISKLTGSNTDIESKPHFLLDDKTFFSPGSPFSAPVNTGFFNFNRK